MKKPLPAVFLLIFVFLALALNSSAQKTQPFSLPAGVTGKDYLPGVLIIKFRESSASSAKLRSRAQTPTVKSSSVISLQQKFPVSESSARTLARGASDAGLSRIYEAKISSAVKIEEVINELLADPQIEYAEPLYIHHTTYISNDPRRVEQPYLEVVRAPQAWDLIRNSSGVIIGIVDSGSELTHPDLAANIHYNTADPVNGLDDDGDGFTDNFAGWDFVGASSNVIQPDNNPNVVGANNDHGVHVSGIASAVTDNNTGVASVAFNARLLIVKAGPDDSGSDILRGYEGIKYAADKGAKIINCSWGSPGGGNFGRDIVNYAMSRGCLIVAAAGNSGTDEAEYPAAYRGVLAVANTDNGDEKSSSSSFGYHVSISAPGTSILSTTFNKTYGFSSGTSMSAPVVSSAAALVQSYFPMLNPQQVGELLRVTSDNIDSKNPDYAGRIGRGRLNVYRALTETSPSVRIQNTMQEEHKAANVLNPDTLYLYFDLKNFLFPATNIGVKLSTLSPEATVLIPEFTVPALGTLETASLIGPFKVAISPQTPSNTEIRLRLTFSANNNAYQDYENLSVIVAKDYLDIHTPSISTTITSNGRIGYSSPSEENGTGFLYKGNQLLYEASLMIGTSAARLSNNARSDASSSDEHFVKVTRAHELVNNADSVKAEAGFNDSGNPNGLSVFVKQQMVAYKQALNDKFAIAEYEVFNTTNFALRNVYVGLYTDWDIGNSATNATQYDVSTRIGYVYNKQQTDNYGAVKLLSQNAAPLYYPLSNGISGNPLSDDVFSTADKWETLSNGVQSLGIGNNTSSGADVSFVSGNGPYDIPANGSIKVAFALIGGDNLQDIQASALIAQQKYNQLNSQFPQEPVTRFDMEVYPNPVFTANDGFNTIRFTLPEEGTVSLDMYNLMGQKVRSLVSNQHYSSGVHFLKYNFAESIFADVISGVYFYRIQYNNESKTKKFSLLR